MRQPGSTQKEASASGRGVGGPVNCVVDVVVRFGLVTATVGLVVVFP